MAKHDGNEVRWLIAEAIQQLAEEADEAVKDERVREYLDFCSRFHQYSFQNRVWLMYQAKEQGIVPTRFAGTKTWNSLNRIVKKGSEAFWVLAPKQKKHLQVVPAKDPETGEILYDPDSGEPLTEEVAVSRTFFDPVWVFDVSQTQVMADRETGEPLKDGYLTLEWAIAAQGDAEELVPLVKKLADTVRFLVEVAEIEGSALGYTDYEKIVCREDLDAPTKVEVLLHEIAHNILAHNHRDIGRETREAEAATTAYVVAKWLGIEPGGARYLALWEQDGKSILACMDRALDASGKMIQDLVRISVKEDPGARAEEPTGEVRGGIPNTSEDECPETREETPPATDYAPPEAEEDGEPVAGEEEVSGEDYPPCEIEPGGKEDPEGEEDGGPTSYIDVSKKELKNLIDVVSMFAGTKGDLEILGSIRFEGSSGMLEARATDLDTTVEMAISGMGEGIFAFAAPARELKGFLKRLGDSIRISKAERSEDITFTDFDVELQVRSQPLEDFPQMPSFSFSFVAEHDFEELRETMKRVSVASSKDEKRPALCSLLLSYKDGNMAATDSYRMAVYEAGWRGTEEVEILLCAKVVREILKLKAAGPARVLYDGDHNVAQICTDGIRLTTKCCEGKFPKYVSFVEDGKGNPIRVRVSAKEFADAVAKVGFGNVTLHVEGQDLHLSSDDRESGIRAKAKLGVLVSVESEEEAYNQPLNIAFNPSFLSDVGSIFEKEPLDIRFKEPLKPAMFSQGKMRYVIMPIRL
ncbi:MAG: hypothetical protein C4575_00535 [Desulforudis sp.]|jgi:DNA polymerase III sliding clamp (beta) subunit (PCNA family)|nr:MAG: hypothetical protein C4575_00535 [Desulforudis sp.]